MGRLNELPSAKRFEGSPPSDVCPMTERPMAAHILPGFFFNTESMLPLWWLPLFFSAPEVCTDKR